MEHLRSRRDGWQQARDCRTIPGGSPGDDEPLLPEARSRCAEISHDQIQESAPQVSGLGNPRSADFLLSKTRAADRHCARLSRLAYPGSSSDEVGDNVDLRAGTLFFDRTNRETPRGVPMHPRVREVLSQVWEAAGKPKTGYVFLDRIGTPYADTREYKLPGGNPLRASHKAACAKAGVSNFRVHDWRHCWASQCVMAGVDLPTLQRLGGWKTLRMVERYAAVADHHMVSSL